MRARDHGLTRADLDLLHRALSYRAKRVHDQAALVRLRGLLTRVEALLLDETGRLSLRLAPPEQETLCRELPLYAEEMTQRGGSEQGAREAKRLRELVVVMAGGGRRSGLSRLWRRFLRR